MDEASDYSRLALMSSKELAEDGDICPWYTETQQRFESHGIIKNMLPPFENILDCPHLNMAKMKENRVI